MIIISSDLKTITVDNEVYYALSKNRLRYSLAHEVGHIILHEEIYRNYFNFNSIDEYLDTITSIPEEEYSWIEYHAYEFGGRLLVPRSKLIVEIYKFEREIKDYLDVYPSRADKEEVVDFLTNYIAKK